MSDQSALTQMRRWEHFEHGADIGVRGFGATVAEAFEAAALAVTAVVTDPSTVQARQTIEFECRAANRELLFYEWINRIVYEMATRRMLFGEFHIELGAGALHARLSGEEIDRIRHAPAVEIKGATLTELKVAKSRDEWCAQCVVDV